jgi:hypothetical protein
MEVNAAYTTIKATLEGSTLYRTSLKGDTILLSFISPQVGERYRPQIQALSQQTGWQLAINPQANQGAIMEIARALLSQAGWSIQKGPGIFLERGEVAVTLTVSPDPDQIAQAQFAFETQTGFRLLINTPAQAKASQAATPPISLIARPAALASDDRRTPPASLPSSIHPLQVEVIEIPIGRIRLRPFHANLALSPDKIEKAVERARRMGTIAPPIQVRRLADGYLLLDGLYRLRAAQQIGLETIPAIIE